MEICLLWLVVQSWWFQVSLLAGKKYYSNVWGYKHWTCDDLPHPLHLVSSDKQQKDHKTDPCVIGNGFFFVFCLCPACNYAS